jgi:hypothetical protein
VPYLRGTAEVRQKYVICASICGGFDEVEKHLSASYDAPERKITAGAGGRIGIGWRVLK